MLMVLLPALADAIEGEEGLSLLLGELAVAADVDGSAVDDCAGLWTEQAVSKSRKMA
jgi:hypothetical protein